MSPTKRIVFTGMGILTCNGKGREDFWQGLKEGRSGFGPVSLFDASELNVDIAGEIKDFEPKKYFGPKGLRTLDRSTKLLVSASKLAINDSGIEITEENTDDYGVSCGTTLGSIKSISDFDEVTLREGPQYTNPSLFPNTVLNSPASQVSIWNNIQGFNTTISSGFTASLDAVQYACDFLEFERARVVLAGGVEEMCRQTFMGFHTLNFLSGAKAGEKYISCPFDKRRNGITFGEGACLLVMEELEHAKARKAKIMGEFIASGYYFDGRSVNRYNPAGTGVKKAIEEVLDNAGMSPKDIDYICANANSTPRGDKVEALAIKEVFGAYGKKVPISSIKSMVGESFSVSGAFGIAAALGAINDGFIPPTVNYEQPDPDIDLNIMTERNAKAKVRNVLVMNFGPSGGHNCMIIRKFEK